MSSPSQLELISLGATAAAALLLVALERRFPYSPGQPLFRRGFFTDLVFYTALQSWLCGVAIAAITDWLDCATGLSRLHLVSGWPVAAQLLFFFVEHDLYIYLFHRWQHRNRYSWRIHEAHHSVADVDWLAGSRSHTLEILVNQTVEYAPMVLLGASPVVPLLKGFIDAVWGMWIHSNVDVRTGWLQRIVNGPEMHRWHHAIEIRDGVNFATKLAVWDWLFGTAYLPAHKPRGFGLTEPFPDGWLRQHLYAFRPFGRGAAGPAPLPRR
jgi:sterol desaturase/sphingolipid hydroxylase (fatty acid hydroxylase superfamily)